MATKSKRGKSGGGAKKSLAASKAGKKGSAGGKGSTTKKGVARKASKSVGAELAAAPTFVLAGSDPSQDNLNKIEHIVVLVMENRSFDHMLGYLKLEGGRDDVDGLTAGMSNTHKGKTYPIHHLQQTAFGHDQDPCHDGDCVTEQLSGGNGGFVSNYAKTHPNDPDPGLVMGYYNGANLPVYDHLAREFTICDRWFCSVDGATWPNRLYAVTGRADGKKVNKKVPLYSLPSFVRHLDAQKVSWRWYCHDIATLRATDDRYRVGSFGHFAYFDRRTLLSRKSFLDDAASGNLAAVSWIDPNFVDLSVIGPSGSNDDHPPSDVVAGQELILKLYNAVINGPKWNKTLLVIIYDEHGGFYDHVPTQAAADDNPNFRTYGVRVPALIVSPFVERGKASNTVFDHTSIIKTILLRFCKRADGTIPDMGARVNAANHLGSLLTQSTARQPPPASAYLHAIEIISQWKNSLFKSNLLEQALGAEPPAPELNELQEGVIKAKRRLRAEGLPEGQP
ncbi:MAG TPA: alkaline phosphatase family protein [Pyrinomonadaceae bacterium]|nr:alkaline phosphatase family protein [Pyrinomonadaceae bacterium]